MFFHVRFQVGFRVTESTIRERILKVALGGVCDHAFVGYRVHDPREDTESLRPGHQQIAVSPCYRAHDPREDTESVPLIQEVELKFLSYRVHDPREDTERSTTRTIAGSVHQVTESTIRERILKAPTQITSAYGMIGLQSPRSERGY